MEELRGSDFETEGDEMKEDIKDEDELEKEDRKREVCSLAPASTTHNAH